MQTLLGIATVWCLGFLYLVGAMPAGVGFGLPIVVTAIIAWTGYAAGASVVLLAGDGLRDWLMRKLKVSKTPDRSKRLYRMWDRFGLWALALLAPVSIGPQAGFLVGLTLGAPKWRLATALALGAIPWITLFAVLTALGVQLVNE